MKLIPIYRCADCEFFISVCSDINDMRKEDETCLAKARCGASDKSLINFELPSLYRELPDYDAMDYIRTIPDWCPKPNRYILVTKCVQCPMYLYIESEGQSAFSRCVELEADIDPWSINSHCPYVDAKL